MATLAPVDGNGGRRSGRRSLRGFRRLADSRSPLALSALIEGEIIPRLMVAHHGAAPPNAASPFPAVNERDVAALAPMTLEVEADVLLAHVEGVLGRGVPLETLLVELLAPTARLLGEWWETDRCDFVEVTMGLWRLQEVVHEIADRSSFTPPRASRPHRALFAAMPGDPHTFGTVVVEEVFRCGGWRTERWFGEAAPDLIERVAADAFDLIGLTISCDCHIAPLSPLIADLRKFSRNPMVSVMVGGRVFVQDPSLVSSVGADGTARDPRLALELAVNLVRARAGEVMAAE